MNNKNHFALFAVLLGMLALAFLLETVSSRYLGTIQAEKISVQQQRTVAERQDKFEYKCDDERNFKVTLTTEDDKAVVQTDDGRLIILSANTFTARPVYSNADNSFVFAVQDEIAFVTEGDSETETYSNCIAR